MATRPPRRPVARRAGSASRARIRARIQAQPLWIQRVLLAGAIVATMATIGLVVLWIGYGRMIDARLAGTPHPAPRVFGRPFLLQPGRGLTPAQLEQRLNDVGYVSRSSTDGPGQFSVTAGSITMRTRPDRDVPGRTVRVDFSRGNTPVITRLIDLQTKRPIDRLALERPVIASMEPGEKRMRVPLASIPQRVIQAVLAIEDRRFYDHPGVDPIRAIGALLTNLRGDRPYLVGGSTLTQQIVKNTFLTPEKSLRRKLQEQFMAVVLESRFTKNQILELYLNDVVLGQRGPFEIHGVAEASRIIFGKHVGNLTLAEAATLAGIIQAPSTLSPFRHPARARDRRNVVLKAMVDAEFITAAEAEKAAAEPLQVQTRALENVAPYFVDYIGRQLEAKLGEKLRPETAIDVYTTLDLHLQRIAQESLIEGLGRIDKQLAGRRRPPAQPAQGAIVAVDPRTGEILALVGGREYSQTQYNRAMAARRQPGSIFKPFVYLAAFEASADGLIDLTPASIVLDEPTTFPTSEGDYTPSNYQDEYDGPVTLRRALAMSRNVATIKVAETAGFDRVADLWKRIGVGTAAKPYPSIALGVFEASPLEIATAYTLFMNGGAVRPLRAIDAVGENGRIRELAAEPARRVARPETVYLVTSLMRSVINEGTAASTRGSFVLDAAGKTGTTNDLRDAWFVGFTPELLTVVWIGFDDNKPIGLSGSQAALPVWTNFMKRALAGRPNLPFSVPPGVVMVAIDRDTGQRAAPGCPPERVMQEAFLENHAPETVCEVHGGNDILGFFSRIGRSLKRIIR
jgi:penicillin-binding protein 1B